MEGMLDGETMGAGEKSRRLKKRDSVGVEGGRGFLLGDSEIDRVGPSLERGVLDGRVIRSNCTVKSISMGALLVCVGVRGDVRGEGLNGFSRVGRARGVVSSDRARIV